MRKRAFVTAAALLCAGLWACAGPGTEQDIYYTGGRDLYRQRCQNCHGKNGEGLGQLVPTLKGMGDRREIACIIKNGKRGVTGNMPASKELLPIDIAKLVVYITNSFGNKHGHYPYRRVEADLEKCK